MWVPGDGDFEEKTPGWEVAGTLGRGEDALGEGWGRHSGWGRRGDTGGESGKGCPGLGRKGRGVGCPSARKAKIRLERLARDHQSWPSTQNMGLSRRVITPWGIFRLGAVVRRSPLLSVL